jgi:hypothetical protein
MKSRLFKMAWAIKNQFSTFAEALTHAWRTIKLQWALCLGVVTFSYKKIDGSTRVATGTLDSVPATKGTRREPNYGLLTYFDLEKENWRSCRIDSLIF